MWFCLEDRLMRQKQKERNFGNVTLRPDGSFVIQRNGAPYHVPENEEFHALFSEIAAYILAHPEMVTPEPPPLTTEDAVTKLPVLVWPE
jgi:hypothetical protein